MIFFKPTGTFLEWLAEYVDGRFVIEVGAGECALTKAMHSVGIKALAVEPYPDDSILTECYNFLLPQRVDQCSILRKSPAVVIAARPDHSGWVSEIPDMLPPESEFLYIGMRANFKVDGIDGDILYANAGSEQEAVVKIQ